MTITPTEAALHTAIYKLEDCSSGWVVEYCNPDDDGMCAKAVFYGRHPERQAREFLNREYNPAPTALIEEVARVIAKDINQHQLETGFAFDIDFSDKPDGLECDWQDYSTTAQALLTQFDVRKKEG